MALDLNALGAGTDRSNERKVKVLLAPLASTVSHFDTVVHSVGLEEIQRRVDRALPILQGQNGSSDQWSEAIAALPEDDQRLVHQVVGGQIHAEEIARLYSEANRLRSSNVVDAVTPTQALTEAITASVAAAAKAATLSTEVTALATEVDKASNELGKALPNEEDIKAVGVGGGTVKKWRTLTEAVETAEKALLAKRAELEAAAKDAKEKAEAVQQELQSVAQAASQARQHSPMPLGR